MVILLPYMLLYIVNFLLLLLCNNLRWDFVDDRSNKLGKWTDGEGNSEGVDDSENDYGEDSDGSSKPNSMTLISSFLIALLSFMFSCSSHYQVMLL